MRLLHISIVLTSLGLAHAQVSDLQPGNNFPTATPLGGVGRTETVDIGDVDADGDFDIIFGNGGDGPPQPNRIFINNGGVQGGTTGVFTEETAARFAGHPNERTRDLDFADFDMDGDLDIIEANTGGVVTPSVQRVYVNQGGVQGGVMGFYAEATDAFWGTLATVPLDQQVLGGNAGPFRDWSCDCDFADLDDDGDLDLFASGYGPNANGTRDSRIFINDGMGVFNEHSPWADPLADIRWHTFDVELVDLDGDFDVDLIASSRDSQARVFVNNTHNPLPGATTMFTDTTKPSLIDVFASQIDTDAYDMEVGDLDLDGDLDLWAVNYAGFRERILSNDGVAAGAAPTFTRLNNFFGEPDELDHEVDLLDFDGDGDLDSIAANSGGTNHLFVNAQAQGLNEFIRAGAGGVMSPYPQDERPTSNNSAQTLDVDVADLDGDGDTDAVMANETIAPERIWFNTLGIPDTHAPTFAKITDDVALVGMAVIHAAVRDNDAVYNVGFYDVDLIVSIDGAAPVSLPMHHSGSMIFRAEINLGAGASSLSYHVEATDLAGNMGVSATVSFDGSWTDLGGGIAGVDGVPSLEANGTLAPSGAGTLTLTNAAPSAPLLLAVSPPSAGVPFKGGVLLAFPINVGVPLTALPDGTLNLPYSVPSDAPSGAAIHVQVLIGDNAAVQNAALTNGLRGDVP